MKKVVTKLPEVQELALSNSVSSSKIYLIKVRDHGQFVDRYGMITSKTFDSRDWVVRCFEGVTRSNTFCRYNYSNCSLQDAIERLLASNIEVYEFDDIFDLAQFILKNK